MHAMKLKFHEWVTKDITFPPLPPFLNLQLPNKHADLMFFSLLQLEEYNLPAQPQNQWRLFNHLISEILTL